MQALKAIVVTALISLSAAVHGAEATPEGALVITNSAPPPLEVNVKREGGPGLITTSRAYVTAGTNIFAFLVPDGFKWDSSDPQKVTLTKVDASAVLTVRLVAGPTDDGKTLSADDGRRRLLAEHPGARIAEEFFLPAANQRGPAFEIQWRAGNLARASRVAYIALPSGILEFSLDSSPDKLGQSLGDLNYVMVTFRASDANGRLEATPLSVRN